MLAFLGDDAMLQCHIFDDRPQSVWRQTSKLQSKSKKKAATDHLKDD